MYVRMYKEATSASEIKRGREREKDLVMIMDDDRDQRRIQAKDSNRVDVMSRA